MLMDYILKKMTTEHYPNLISKRCIRFSSASNKCTLCEEICPKDAIDFENGKIKVNEDACNSCGICKGVCPTQAINLKGIGEENVLRTIGDKDNIVFSCSQKNGAGTLKISCLSALHPELLAALFIMNDNRLFQFNISKCKDCELVNQDNLLLLKSLEKAEDFVKLLGIEPKYEIVENEESLSSISEKNISRRELFTLFKKESTNIATQTLDTLITDDNDYLSIRSVLLNAIQEKSDVITNGEIKTKTLLGAWNINGNCNGCKDCQSVCPNKAWKIEKIDNNLHIYYNAGKCYQCGQCESKCSKKAIEDGNLSISDINKYSLKNQLALSQCSLCHKDFVIEDDEDQCSICKKKLEMRSKIASF